MGRARSKKLKDFIRKLDYEEDKFTPKKEREYHSIESIQRYFTLQYSYHDQKNGEVVHTVKTEPVVYEKAQEYFGKIYKPFLEQYDYGQVLNYHPVRVYAPFGNWHVGVMV